MGATTCAPRSLYSRAFQTVPLRRVHFQFAALAPTRRLFDTDPNSSSVPPGIPMALALASPRRSQHVMRPPDYRNTEHAMFERGDLWGFQELLAILRIAEHGILPDQKLFPLSFDDNREEYANNFAYLIRALPAVGKLAWLQKEFGLLCKIAQGFRDRDPIARNHFFINWEIIEGQRTCEDYEPCRGLRKKHRYTRRFFELADPISVRFSSHSGTPPPWPPRSLDK